MNLRTPKRADLQSAAIDRSATPPHVDKDLPLLRFSRRCQRTLFTHEDFFQMRPPKKSPFPQKQGNTAPKAGGYYLYGFHAVLAALGNPQRKNKKLLVTGENATRPELLPFTGKMPIETCAKQDLERVLPMGAVHQGIALLTSPLEQRDLEVFLRDAPEHTALIVLDQVTDPHNVGAILRSSAAFGASAVVVQARHSPEESGTLAKAASGALENVPYISVTNITRALEYLKKERFWCLGMDAEGSQNLATLNIPEKVALVYGAEGDGLRRLTKENCDVLVHVQTSGTFSSLNVSNAVAVGLYEVNRQKGVA